MKKGYLVPPGRPHCRLQRQQPLPKPQPELWSAGQLPETHTHTPAVNTHRTECVRQKARGRRGEERREDQGVNVQFELRSTETRPDFKALLLGEIPFCLVSVTPVTVRQKKRLCLIVRVLATVY